MDFMASLSQHMQAPNPAVQGKVKEGYEKLIQKVRSMHQGAMQEYQQMCAQAAVAGGGGGGGGMNSREAQMRALQQMMAGGGGNGM